MTHQRRALCIYGAGAGDGGRGRGLAVYDHSSSTIMVPVSRMCSPARICGASGEPGKPFHAMAGRGGVRSDGIGRRRVHKTNRQRLRARAASRSRPVDGKTGRGGQQRRVRWPRSDAARYDGAGITCHQISCSHSDHKLSAPKMAASANTQRGIAPALPGSLPACVAAPPDTAAGAASSSLIDELITL